MKWRRKKTEIYLTNCINTSVKNIPDTYKSIFTNVGTSCTDVVKFKIWGTMLSLGLLYSYQCVVFLEKQDFNREAIMTTQEREWSG